MKDILKLYDTFKKKSSCWTKILMDLKVVKGTLKNLWTDCQDERMKENVKKEQEIIETKTCDWYDIFKVY